MKQRILIAVFWVWVFINIYLLISGYALRGGEIFSTPNYYGLPDNATSLIFPFDSHLEDFYDITEFILFVGFPALIFYLFRYIKTGSIINTK